MRTSTALVLAGLAAGVAYVLAAPKAGANSAGPYPPVPAPSGTYKRGDTVLVPVEALFPTGAVPFPVDPTMLLSGATVDTFRILLDSVLPGGLLQGRVIAYHGAGPTSDAWVPLNPPFPSPPFPEKAVSAKLLTVL